MVIFQSLVLKVMPSFKVENLHLLKEILGNHKVLAPIKIELLANLGKDRLVQESEELEWEQVKLSKDSMK